MTIFRNKNTVVPKVFYELRGYKQVNYVLSEESAPPGIIVM